MKIYLIRHGQCNSNLNKVFNYQNEDLNENGIKQAEFLREKIEQLEIDAIYSSPLLRAKHTAQIVNTKNKNVILDNRLKERECGLLEGKPLDSIDREEYWNYYSNKTFTDEEKIPELFDRVSKFIEELKTKEYKSVLIVAHSGVSKAFYAYFNGIPTDGKLLELGLKNIELKEYNL